MSRTLVIGDIHGGLKALEQVLERCEYDKTKDQLIFLGDYVDGWSESSETINHLIDIQEKSSIKPIFLLGNHDEWVRDFLDYGRVDSMWLNNGGKTTLRSYNNLWSTVRSEEMLEKHRNFFNSLHNSYVDEDNRAFVHAGCDTDRGVNGTMPYMKVWDRTMWKLVLSGKTVKAHKELYIGHTPTEIYKCKKHLPEANLQEVDKPITVPMNRQNVWNLDTGGGWGGKLSVMDIDTKDFWQSDLVSDLYPYESGRN